MRNATLAGVAGFEVATVRTTSLSFRVRTALVAVSTIVLAIVPMMDETAAAAPTNYSYTAAAYGTSVSVGSVVKSDRSALVTLGCTNEAPLEKTNATAGINLGALGRTGAVSTVVRSYASPIRSLAGATTADVNLLAGLVRATTIKAVSYTTRDDDEYELGSGGSRFTGLVVAGRAITANPAPNTRINLAGVDTSSSTSRSGGATG